MRYSTIIELFAAVAVLCGSVFGVGSGTMPSSHRGGPGTRLIKSPNPIDQTSSLSITGNVRRGKHFRGVVPYNSTTAFGSVTGSSSLDDFLRDSAGSEDFGQFSGKTQPFYSPTRTVTTLSPSSGKVLRPPSGRIDSRVRYDIDDTALDTGRFIKPDSSLFRARFKGLNTFVDTEKTPIDAKAKVFTSIGEERDADYQRRLEEFKGDVEALESRADELRADLLNEDTSLKKPGVSEAEARKLSEIGLRKELPGEEVEVSNVFEKMQLDLKKLGEIMVKQKEREAVAEPGDEEQQEGEEVVAEKTMAELIGEIDLNSAQAKEILGEHKTFASYANDRFNQKMREAEAYLKAGEFYRASDAYRVANIYRPGDPLAYAGRSHALFAAGEYMSSALFLSRTLTLFAEYAYLDIDLVAMVGDRDVLESRISDIKEWIERSDAGELHFLLSYVYYQLDRQDEAAAAIEKAYEKMSDLSSVVTLRKAIIGAAE